MDTPLFAKHIILGRAYLSISRDELAKELGLSLSAVKNLEKGDGEVSCRNITERRIKKFFEDRGIVFLVDNNIPNIKYDPDKILVKIEE